MTATAAGAVSSPFWLPTLHDISAIAADLAPVLGLVVLLVQIWIKIDEYRRRRNFHKELREQLNRSNNE